MLMNNLEESLLTISNELKSIEERRENLLKGTRDIISLCSKSIVDQHYGKRNEAREKLTKASTMLAEFRDYAEDDLKRYMLVPEQEFVEASVLMSIIDNSEIPGVLELKVSGPSYTLGLLDSIGETKRMIYDRIRQGKSNDARELFKIMEHLYSLIYPFAIYDNLVGGLRRKLDVAKMLIEDIRALITEESRRGNLIRAIEQLEARLIDAKL
jgi:translin